MITSLAGARTAVAWGYGGGQGASGEKAFFTIMGYFRETNEEGQRLRGKCLEVMKLAQAGAPDEAVEAFEGLRKTMRSEIEQAKGRNEPIDKLRRDQPEDHAWYARELVRVTNSWDDLHQLWPVSHPKDEPLAKLAARAGKSVEVLNALIFTCACQTIPDELGNFLGNYKIGRKLDFVKTFNDQLTEEAQTRLVLATIAPQSGVVSGLIDLESATIMKADPRWWRQALSVVWVLLVAAMGFGLIAAAVNMGRWFHLDDAAWMVKQSAWAPLNGAYLLVLLGVLGHWVLDRVKLARAGTDMMPLSEWLMWIHINEVAITVRIATVWLVVLLSVAFKAFDFSKGLQPVTCFTAGYFMDSTFDALVGRFNTFIGSKDAGKKA